MLPQVHVRYLLKEAYVPTGGGPVEPLRVLVSEEKRQLERLRETHELELGGRGQCLRNVPAVESAAEPYVGRALSDHEPMFA